MKFLCSYEDKKISWMERKKYVNLRKKRVRYKRYGNVYHNVKMEVENETRGLWLEVTL